MEASGFISKGPSLVERLMKYLLLFACFQQLAFAREIPSFAICDGKKRRHLLHTDDKDQNKTYSELESPHLGSIATTEAAIEHRRDCSCRYGERTPESARDAGHAPPALAAGPLIGDTRL